jgi:hypothetical protein
MKSSSASSSPSSDITPEVLEPYTVLPVLTGNPFIKTGTGVEIGTSLRDDKLSASTERAHPNQNRIHRNDLVAIIYHIYE